MKRHVRDNKGRLLQLDKKWKNLRVGQKEWISNELRIRYLEACEDAGGVPSKRACGEILFKVIEMIEQRGIWIPDDEVIRYFNKKKGSWLKKYLKQKEDTFSEQILADLTAQGYSGDELLTAFEEAAVQVRPAVEAMLEEAERASVQPDKYASYADVFSPEDEE